MYTKKELTRKAEMLRKSGDLEAAGMVERLLQLQFSFIPQLKAKMEEAGFKFTYNENGGVQPHRTRNPPCTHQNS